MLFPVDPYNCHRVVAETLLLDPVNYLKALTPKVLRPLAVNTPDCGDLSILMNKVDGKEFPSHSAFILNPNADPLKALTIAKLGCGRPVAIETLGDYDTAQRKISDREAMKIDSCYSYDPVMYTVPLRSFLGLFRG